MMTVNKTHSALILEILKQGNELAMSVFEQEELASTIKHYGRVAVSPPQTEKLCRQALSALSSRSTRDPSSAEALSALKKSGQLLWDYLLTRLVKDRLRTAQAQGLALSLDEELIDIPWELLYDGKDFLCLKFSMGRLVRTKDKATPVQYRSLSGSLKMLILANPTSDLKSSYLEGVHIKNHFDKKRSRIRIDFKSTDIDTLYVKKNLRDYDVVHFAGHCEHDSVNPHDSGWVLSDGRFSVQDILSLGDSMALPALIFSNACYSAGPDTQSGDTRYQAKAYSLASAFLFSGTRHYIGAIRRIEDPLSHLFAEEFYSQLVLGKSVGECVRLARLRLVKEHGMDGIFWAGYLLYGDPNFVLFRQKAKPDSSRPKRSLADYKKPALWFLAGAGIISLCAGLYLWFSAANPGAQFLFSKADRLLARGLNQEAIAVSDEILKKDPLFLKAYPLIAEAYLRQGEHELALKYYFEYALSSGRKQDKNSLARAYTGIGWIYHIHGSYPRALEFYSKAVSLSRQNRDKLNEAVALRKLAVWHMDKEGYDLALELLMKSSEINRDRQLSREHRYNLACDYFDIGLAFANKDDFPAAKEFYAKSRQLFEKLKAGDELSDYYFNLGEIHLFEKQYQDALYCYMKGLGIDQAQGNLPGIASDHNMLGELYAEMGNLSEAEESFNRALSICKKIDSPLELAATYYNLGLLYKAKGRRNQAREYLRSAQEIYSKVDTPDYQRVKEELLALSETTGSQ